MSQKDKEVIGYLAVHQSQGFLCDGEACIIAGSESTMRSYIKSLSEQAHKFQVKEVLFGGILKGMSVEGLYAFDETSYGRFLPLANKNGFTLTKQDFPSAGPGLYFVVVGDRT